MAAAGGRGVTGREERGMQDDAVSLSAAGGRQRLGMEFRPGESLQGSAVCLGNSNE